MMNYLETLDKLRREVFSETSTKPKQTTGFIPIRSSAPTEDSRDIADRPKEWLKAIKQASEEAKKSAPKSGGNFASGLLGALVKPKKEAQPEVTKAANKEAFIARRGNTPSTYSPDRQLTPNTGTLDLGGKEGFINAIYPTAIEVGKATGIDPRIIVAQAALESGWGKSAPNNNYFGIKSHGRAGGSVLTTSEVVNGKTVTIQDSFRQFDSPADSVRGYGEFLLANPRYKSPNSNSNFPRSDSNC